MIANSIGFLNSEETFCFVLAEKGVSGAKKKNKAKRKKKKKRKIPKATLKKKDPTKL